MARVKNASSHSRNVVAPHTDDSMDSVPYFPTPTNYALRENPKLVMPKNDTPNKFWLSVEPYCMPISHEDIKVRIAGVGGNESFSVKSLLRIPISAAG